MLTLFQRVILLILFGVIGLLFSATFARSPITITPERTTFDVNLTLGSFECALESRRLAKLSIDELNTFENYNSTTFTIPETCVAVHSRLRASIDQALWLSLSIEDQKDWLKLHTLESDANPPKLDKRGRYFGCAMPDNGYHTCRVGFEMEGQHYQVFVPIRVGVLGKYRRTTTVRKPAETITNTATTIAIEPVEKTVEVPTMRYGRGISIPDLGFYSGITTFPLTNGTWQIAVEEPLVGHLCGEDMFQMKRLSGIKSSFRQTLCFKIQLVKNCKPSLNKLQCRRIRPS